MYFCKECEASFVHHKNLLLHLRRKHGIAGILECDVCAAKFNFKTRLIKHLETHGFRKNENRKTRSRIICPICKNQNFTRYNKLIEHFKLVHEEHNIEEEVLHFKSESEFLAWKKEMEKKTFSYYVREGDKSRCKQYYTCHRSYQTALKENRKRRMKSGGTRKIGYACVSHMIAHKLDEGLRVHFYKNHVGHDIDITAVNLTKEDRIKIAGKLASSVSVQQIIDEIRDSCGAASNASIERIHLLKKRDLYNIRRDFRINNCTKWSKNDTRNIRLWVKEMSAKTPSPIIFFKDQGESNGTLLKDEFVLVLMTPFQQKQLVEFSGDKFCVDGTYGVNDCDFQLLSLIIVDDFGNGIPVSFCFSNRSHSRIFELFFECIKRQVGCIIEADTFMCDDDPRIYNAWSHVMAPVNNKLLCTWHLHRNILKNLTKIKDTSKKSTVFKTMCALLSISDESEFLPTLQKILTDLKSDPDTTEFAYYFENVYAFRAEEWASCYRTHIESSINVFLESTHESLKHHYLEGKRCRRLDEVIRGVLKLVDDKAFDYNASSRLLCILKNHENSKSIDVSAIQVLVDEEKWSVPSSNKVETFTVKRHRSCSDCTMLVCTECNICLHSFLCSCSDNAIYYNICEHIHALNVYLQDKKRKKSQSPIRFLQCYDDIADIKIDLTENVPDASPCTNGDEKLETTLSDAYPCTNKLIKAKLKMAQELFEKNLYTRDELIRIYDCLDELLTILNNCENESFFNFVSKDKK